MKPKRFAENRQSNASNDGPLANRRGSKGREETESR